MSKLWRHIEWWVPFLVWAGATNLMGRFLFTSIPDEVRDVGTLGILAGGIMAYVMTIRSERNRSGSSAAPDRGASQQMIREEQQASYMDAMTRRQIEERQSRGPSSGLLIGLLLVIGGLMLLASGVSGLLLS